MQNILLQTFEDIETVVQEIVDYVGIHPKNLVFVHEVPRGPLHHMADISKDDSTCATIGRKDLKIWDVESGELKRHIQFGSDGSVTQSNLYTETFDNPI